MRLGILTSHPIQYYAPWFRALAEEIDLDVLFSCRPNATEQGEGFDTAFTWDIDLLSGYRHQFLRNVAKHPGTNRFSGCNTPEIRNIICKNQYDAFIVSGWNLRSYWQAVCACRSNNVPVLVRGDSQLAKSQFSLKRFVKRAIYPLMLKQFDGFLYVGRRNREYLTYYGVPAEKMFFAPHFVDNQRFIKQAEATRDQRSEIRDQWRIPRDAFCVLFCGKFIPKKRPLDLVKAAQLLLSSHPELKLHLLFVGSGELGPELRATCNVVFNADDPNSYRPALNSRKPRATFAGFLNQTEISRAYVAADCLVLPSDSRETWGLVVNEAMVCGLPAIVSDAIGCAPDLIDEGRTGFTFEVGNSSHLAQRLRGFVELEHRGYNFRSAMAERICGYSIKAAVNGTIDAVGAISSRLKTVRPSSQTK